MSDFFSMGGYASYVWTSYAVFALTLLVDALAPAFARRRALRQLRGRLKRQIRRAA